MSTLSSYDELLASAADFKLRHKTEFRSDGDELLILTVRQNVIRKAGLKKLGQSILMFDFYPATARTATSSPTTSTKSNRNDIIMRAPAYESDGGAVTGRGAQRAAAETGRGRERGHVESTRTGRSSSVCMVFFHNRYNGAKQLYVNRRLVYSVEKECTDGNMNTWVIPLPFGRILLKLVAKLLTSSGFEYSLTIMEDGRRRGGGTVLYKSTR